jgi:hypothetical protein
MIEPISIEVTAGFAKTLRREVITEGQNYLIKPLNARRSHYQGLNCTVIQFIKAAPGKTSYVAVVRLHPTNRIVQIEIVDLVSVKTSRPTR